MDNTPNTCDLTAGQVSSILRSVLISRAAILAREGSFNEAENLLKSTIESGTSDIEYLDLMARIRAQQGSFQVAENLWQQVLCLDSSHPGAQAGLTRLRNIHRPLFWIVPVSIFALGVILLSGLVGGYYLISHDTTQKIDHIRATWESHSEIIRNDTEQKLNRLLSESSDLVSQITKVTNQTKGVIETQQKANDAMIAKLEGLVSTPYRQQQLPINLNTPGISTRPDGNSLLVRFDKQLFNRQGKLRPNARAVLKSISDNLQHIHGPLRLEVVTQDMMLVRDKGNSLLRKMHRAKLISKVLQNATPIVHEQVSIVFNERTGDFIDGFLGDIYKYPIYLRIIQQKVDQR
jgi:hypothetical protein